MFAYVVGFFYALAQMLVGGWLLVALVRALRPSPESKAGEHRSKRLPRSSNG
jgi:hypothetical protein